MSKTFAIRYLALALLISVAMTLAGCGSKGVDGKYVSDGGVATVEFKSGKATFTTVLGNAETCTYTQDGDKITLHPDNAPGGDMVLTVMQDGSLQGVGGSFKKAAN